AFAPLRSVSFIDQKPEVQRGGVSGQSGARGWAGAGSAGRKRSAPALSSGPVASEAPEGAMGGVSHPKATVPADPAPPRPRPPPAVRGARPHFSNSSSTGTTLMLSFATGRGNFSMVLSSVRISGGVPAVS